MTSHGGQLTFAQKKMLAMQAANTENSTLAAPQYSGPHTAAMRQQPVPFHSDVEMRDVSAATSTHGSPVTIPPHARPQSSSNFSAAAKPFTPPGSDISVLAAPVSSVKPSPITSNMAPPITPAKRAPPHRTLKGQTPAAPLTAPVTAPTAALKPGFAVTPVMSDHSAAPSPKRRAGPHTKLGPHAQRTPVSHSTASVDSAPPVQISIPSKATTPASTAQDAWVDMHQPKSEPEAWVDVQEPEVDMDVEEPAAHQVDMETEQSPVQPTPVASAQDWGTPAVNQSLPVASTQDWGTPAVVEPEQSSAQAVSPPADIQSLPVASTQDWGTPAVVEPEKSSAQAASPPEAVVEPPTPEAASHSPQEQEEAQAESTEFALSEEMSTHATTVRRYGRNEFLPMLLDMTDTAKGREVIRAFADHIHAGGDTSLREVATPDAQQEIWMELSGGQRLAATVPQNTTLINAIREVAKMTRADESEVRIILKVGVKDST